MMSLLVVSAVFVSPVWKDPLPPAFKELQGEWRAVSVEEKGKAWDSKKEIAEVDSVYRAKIAEREVFLKDQIRKAQIAGNLEEAQSLEKQLASEMRRLQEECEAKKEKLRASFAG